LSYLFLAILHSIGSYCVCKVENIVMKKLFNIKVLLVIIFSLVVFTFATMFTYKYLIVRYLTICMVVMIVVLLRHKMQVFLKELKK
jgi:hypothetical protein